MIYQYINLLYQFMHGHTVSYSVIQCHTVYTFHDISGFFQGPSRHLVWRIQNRLTRVCLINIGGVVSAAFISPQFEAKQPRSSKNCVHYLPHPKPESSGKTELCQEMPRVLHLKNPTKSGKYRISHYRSNQLEPHLDIKSWLLAERQQRLH